jgi:hypothetical protein
LLHIVAYLLKAGARKPAETDFAGEGHWKHPTAIEQIRCYAKIGNRYVTTATVTRATKKEEL